MSYAKIRLFANKIQFFFRFSCILKQKTVFHKNFEGASMAFGKSLFSIQ